MNIPVNKVLDKMSVEIQKAKSEEHPSKKREYLQAIRTLCDLILEESPSEKTNMSKPIHLSSPSTTSFPSASKLEEDDANGESLFDF